MPKTLEAVQSSNVLNPSLLALTPRQVLLSRPTMVKKDASEKESKTSNLKPDQKALLLRSVARYLYQSGFSKSSKKLLSEAEIEKKDWDSTLPDLEEIFCEYLKKRDCGAEDLIKLKTGDIHIHGEPKKDAEESVTAEEANDKKKKKKRKVEENGHDYSAAAGASKKTLEENVSSDLERERKERKKKKKEVKSSDGKKGADVDKQDKVKDLDCSTIAEAPRENLLKETLEENGSSHLEKKKKEKNKKEEEPNSDVNEKEEDTNVETKDKPKNKKKRNKSEASEAETLKDDQKTKVEDEMEKKKKEELKSDVNEEEKEDADIKTEDRPKDKKKKNKSKGSKVETLKDDQMTKVEEEVEKVSKKRKRPETEEKNEGTLDDKEDESKRRKKDDNENINVVQKTPEKQPDVEENGNMERTGGKTAKQKSGKMQLNGSKEPKKPFQRVNVEEVEFVDERLRDNSYWAKDGADSGYGAKAQEVLGQVRGRGFRHEKTKKKRGSYRGGMIDLQSHSVKFNYSDEE